MIICIASKFEGWNMVFQEAVDWIFTMTLIKYSSEILDSKLEINLPTPMILETTGKTK